MAFKFVLLLAFALILVGFVKGTPMRFPGETNVVPSVICKLPPARGHCRALLIRWRYDPLTKKCSEFKFGGCDGNSNNFRSREECMAMCGGI